MTLSPSLRGGSSYTGAILPRRPPRLGAAGFTDPVGLCFIKRARRSEPSPGRRLESRSSPAELKLFRAVPTSLCPFPSPFPAPRRPRQGLQPGSAGPCPFSRPSAAELGPGALSLILNGGRGRGCVRGPDFHLLARRQVQGSRRIRDRSQVDTPLQTHPTALEERAVFGFHGRF